MRFYFQSNWFALHADSCRCFSFDMNTQAQLCFIPIYSLPVSHWPTRGKYNCTPQFYCLLKQFMIDLWPAMSITPSVRWLHTLIILICLILVIVFLGLTCLHLLNLFELLRKLIIFIQGIIYKARKNRDV